MTEAPRSNWASWAIALAGGAAIVAGLAVVGGPGQARKEQRDQTRMEHLRALADHAQCLAGTSGALSAEMTTTDDCGPPPDDRDPLTGQPYRIALLASGNLRLCADLEAEDALDRRRFYSRFDRDGNCLVVSAPTPVRDPQPGPVVVVPESVN